MSRICLLALIGLPGAGKTCLSNWLMQQQAALSDWNILHVCYDDYFQQESIHIDNDYKNQRQRIFQLLTELIEKLRFKHDNPILHPPEKVRLAASLAVSTNYLIICDDNHYYRSMRYKLYQLCRDQSCIYAQIHVASCLTDCLLANAKRDAQFVVPETIMCQMQTRLEAPSEDAWACNSLTLTNSDFNAVSQVICDFVKSLLNSEVVAAAPEATVIKQPQLQSLVHQLDLQLRARIQAKMQHVISTIPKPIQSRTLNEQRKQILAQFRLDIGGKQTDLNELNLEYYVNLLN